MIFDGIIAVIVLVFAMFGYFSGALSQIFGFASLAMAFLLAKPAGEVVGRILMNKWQQPRQQAMIMGAIVAGVGIYIAARIFFMIVNFYLGRKGAHKNKWNRRMGALLGGVKMTVILWVLFCCLTETSLKGWLPPNVDEQVKTSNIARWMVKTYNPVASWRVVMTIEKLSDIAQHPQIMQELARNPQIREVIVALQGAVNARSEGVKLPENAAFDDPSRVVEASGLRDVLLDRELIEALLDVDVEAAINQVYDTLPEDEGIQR